MTGGPGGPGDKGALSGTEEPARAARTPEPITPSLEPRRPVWDEVSSNKWKSVLLLGSVLLIFAGIVLGWILPALIERRRAARGDPPSNRR